MEALSTNRISQIFFVSFLPCCSVSLLWFAAVFDPIGGLFGIRYVALIWALLVVPVLFVLGRVQIKLNLRTYFVLYLSVVTPMYGIFRYSSFASSEKFIDTSYVAAGILLLTSFLYTNSMICKFGVRSMVFSLRLLVLVISLLFFSQVSGLDTGWINIFTESDVAIVSFREYAGIRLPYIYFLASPMLIYLIAYDLSRLHVRFSVRNFMFCSFSIMAFCLSGTRAHILIGFTYPVLYRLIVYPMSPSSIILAILATTLAVYFIGTTDLLLAFFNPNETSNSMKIAMLENYGNIFSNPGQLLLGQGYNAYEWSLELRDMIVLEDQATRTELTYVEMVRVYGLVLALPFFGLIFMLIRDLARITGEFRWLYPGALIYMANAAINPYFFSTNGILPLCLMISVLAVQKDVVTRGYCVG